MLAGAVSPAGFGGAGATAAGGDFEGALGADVGVCGGASAATGAGGAGAMTGSGLGACFVGAKGAVVASGAEESATS